MPPLLPFRRLSAVPYLLSGPTVLWTRRCRRGPGPCFVPYARGLPARARAAPHRVRACAPLKFGQGLCHTQVRREPALEYQGVLLPDLRVLPLLANAMRRLPDRSSATGCAADILWAIGRSCTESADGPTAIPRQRVADRVREEETD